MHSQIIGLRVAGIIFGLLALAQLLRLVLQPPIVIAGHPMPLWPSVVAFLVLGRLCLWLLTLARARYPRF